MRPLERRAERALVSAVIALAVLGVGWLLGLV